MIFNCEKEREREYIFNPFGSIQLYFVIESDTGNRQTPLYIGQKISITNVFLIAVMITFIPRKILSIDSIIFV